MAAVAYHGGLRGSTRGWGARGVQGAYRWEGGVTTVNGVKKAYACWSV